MLDVTKEINNYCGTRFAWRVRAKDKDSAWGEWSAWAYFYSSYPVATTPSPTQDTLGPQAPTVVEHPNNSSVNCEEKFNLVWNPVTDSSGIQGYRVEIYRYYNSEWSSIFVMENTEKTSLTLNLQNACLHTSVQFTWSVQGRDGAGNLGAYSLSYFWAGIPVR